MLFLPRDGIGKRQRRQPFSKPNRMLINDIVPALETAAPLRFAADWDNVGLLAGSSDWDASAVMLTIDLTAAVLEETLASPAAPASPAAQSSQHSGTLIVAYHPPIFSALKSLTNASPKQRVVLDAIAWRAAIYSPHTALDAAPGGINDWLAEAIGGPGVGDVRALEPAEVLPESEQCKLVVYCPADAVDPVRNGLASIGAGQIGRYQLCSFELPGRGTFFAGEGTKPAVGMRGSLQHVDEVRLEMVCPKVALALAITTLRHFHPYEEPAFEIYPLLPRPQRHIGQGRRVTLDQAASLKTIIERIKQHLSLKHVEVALAHDAPTKYLRIGLCAGAGGSLLLPAIEQGCQLFFTGEMRHHDVLEAQARGCTVILAGHTNTERGYLRPLRKRLIELLPNVTINISKRDVNPLRMM